MFVLSGKSTEQNSPLRTFRAPRVLLVIVCAGALCFCCSTVVHQITCSWYLAHDIQGFVAYAAHEDKYSPDARHIAVAFRDQGKVLELASGAVVSRLEKYAGQGLSDFSSTGKIVSRFFRGKGDHEQACVWNAASGRMAGHIIAPENENLEKCAPVFSPDGTKIVAAFAHGLVIWDSLNLERLGKVQVEWPRDEWLPGLLAWNPLNQELTTVGGSGELLKIDLRKEVAAPLLFEELRPVKSARWSSDGAKLLTIEQEEGAVVVWNVQAGAVVARIPETDVLHASFSPDGTKVVTARQREPIDRTRAGASLFWGRSTKIWDATTGNLIRDLPTAGVVSFSPDWDFQVENGPEGVRIAKCDGSESCHFSKWFDGHGSSCKFAQDNSYLACINGSGRVAVWKPRDPSRRWMGFMTCYEFWASLLALLALAWAISGFQTRVTKTSSADKPPQ